MHRRNFNENYNTRGGGDYRNPRGSNNQRNDLDYRQRYSDRATNDYRHQHFQSFANNSNQPINNGVNNLGGSTYADGGRNGNLSGYNHWSGRYFYRGGGGYSYRGRGEGMINRGGENYGRNNFDSFNHGRNNGVEETIGGYKNGRGNKYNLGGQLNHGSEKTNQVDDSVFYNQNDTLNKRMNQRLARFSQKEDDIVKAKSEIEKKSKSRGSLSSVDLTPVLTLLDEDSKVHADYKGCVDDGDELLIDDSEDNVDFPMMSGWDVDYLDKKIIENIKACGYVKPNKVQKVVIPAISTQQSLRVCARTGSGKTAAYMIPLVQVCFKTIKREDFNERKGCPIAIVIASTRELAFQYCEQGRKFAYETGVKLSFAVGGFNFYANIEEINKGCHVLVATPGRLLHLVQSGIIHFDKLDIIVFDEADELLRDHVVTAKLQKTFKDANNDYQIIFFSASLHLKQIKEKIEKLGLTCDNILSLTDGGPRPTTKADHVFEEVGDDKKLDKLQQLLIENKDDDKIILVFCNDCESVEFLAITYRGYGIKASPVSSLNDPILREKASNAFRDGKIKVLITTDLYSRGIDVKQLDFVINFDMPTSATTFLHRVGRCGRIRKGKTVSFVTSKDVPVLEEIKTMYGDDAPPETLTTVIQKLKQ